MIWPAVIVGSLGAYLLKLSGYVIPERVLDNPRLQRLTTILPIALLAALVGVQTFSTGDAVQVDARVAGLAAAIVALALRAPFLVVILVAAATAAVLRGAGLAPQRADIQVRCLAHCRAGALAIPCIVVGHRQTKPRAPVLTGFLSFLGVPLEVAVGVGLGGSSGRREVAVVSGKGILSGQRLAHLARAPAEPEFTNDEG